jgi:hypothetical protein
MKKPQSRAMNTCIRHFACKRLRSRCKARLAPEHADASTGCAPNTAPRRTVGPKGQFDRAWCAVLREAGCP